MLLSHHWCFISPSKTQSSSQDIQYTQQIFQSPNQDMLSDSKIKLRRTTKHNFKVMVDTLKKREGIIIGTVTKAYLPAVPTRTQRGKYERQFPFLFSEIFTATYNLIQGLAASLSKNAEDDNKNCFSYFFSWWDHVSLSTSQALWPVGPAVGMPWSAAANTGPCTGEIPSYTTGWSKGHGCHLQTLIRKGRGENWQEEMCWKGSLRVRPHFAGGGAPPSLSLHFPLSCVIIRLIMWV